MKVVVDAGRGGMDSGFGRVSRVSCRFQTEVGGLA